MLKGLDSGYGTGRSAARHPARLTETGEAVTIAVLAGSSP